MTEVELKAALTAAQALTLPARLTAMGFAPAETLRETDLYFNGTQRNFRTTDEALRLRRCQNPDTGETVSLVTYKGPKRDGRSNTRTEYETAVADPETLRGILQALGYTPQYLVDKTRRHFTRDSITVCLDTVADLGSYAELETVLTDGTDHDAAVDALLSLLDALEIPREALSRRSYLELLIAAGVVQNYG